MAIEFKDVSSEPATSETTQLSVLPAYQTTISEDTSSLNTTNHQLELTVVDSASRQERCENENLKHKIHMSQVKSGVIIVKIAEMVFNLISFIAVRESPFANTTPGICFSLVSSLGLTITGCLLALYACGACKKPCITVLPFEYVFCILWTCAFLAASCFLINSNGIFKSDYNKAPIYGFVSMILYSVEACLNCRFMVQRNKELQIERENSKVSDNFRGWNQPASEAYNGTESSIGNNNDPNEHWTRSYDLNAISDGCIIIF